LLVKVSYFGQAAVDAGDFNSYGALSFFTHCFFNEWQALMAAGFYCKERKAAQALLVASLPTMTRAL